MRMAPTPDPRIPPRREPVNASAAPPTRGLIEAMTLPDRHTLILLRHAKSDWSGGEPDFERPLAPRGLRQAPETGQWLEGSPYRPELAVVSPAARARATWELVAAQLTEAPQARTDDRVYAATADELLTVVRGLPDSAATALLVGHNPGLEDLVHRLTGDPVRLTTSALAVIEVAGAWPHAGRATGSLRAVGRPPVPR
jgi:phosphohistidine phosphatase